MKTVPSPVYRPNPVVAVEDFGDRSLALHCEDLRMVELNTTARDLLRRLDGQATLEQVAAGIAADYGQPLEAVLADARETVAQMVELDLVELVNVQGPQEAEKPDA